MWAPVVGAVKLTAVGDRPTCGVHVMQALRPVAQHQHLVAVGALTYQGACWCPSCEGDVPRASENELEPAMLLRVASGTA